MRKTRLLIILIFIFMQITLLTFNLSIYLFNNSLKDYIITFNYKHIITVLICFSLICLVISSNLSNKFLIEIRGGKNAKKWNS